VRLSEPRWDAGGWAAGGGWDSDFVHCARRNGTEQSHPVALIPVRSRAGWEDTKQCMLQHLQTLRADPMLADSIFVLQIEANLGYESDHHREFLSNCGMTNLVFMQECAHNKGRTGTWTTAGTKDQMQLVFLNAISAGALGFYAHLHTIEDDATAMKRTLFRQLENYSAKLNVTTGKRTFTGKIGDEQDDLAVVVQMNMLYRLVFWEDREKYGRFHRHWIQHDKSD
jgi:hypothetical protein